ncbi:MAG: response regulator [Candidatus Binatia bacterium]
MAKVLTVDDSKVVRTMVSKHLQPYGCRVVEAANGQEGVEVAKREKPDLILLDVTMPVMDGRQALAAIRADGAIKDIPVIMLTAESGKDLVLEIVKLGVKGYIVKPFNKETFEREVSKILGAPTSQPAKPAPAAAAAPATAVPVDPQAVLVVDDSDRILELAREALGNSLNVLTADSGRGAVASFAEAHPAVVVIDLAMPDMDGFETQRQIKAGGGGNAVFIALVVRGDAEAREKAKKTGFRAVVEKPIQAEELLSQVTVAIANAAGGDLVVSDEQGCPVLVCPDPQSKTFAKFVPAAQKKMRALAEDGNDKLILDLATITQVNTGLVKTLVQLIADAAQMGMRTAVCAPAPVVENLKQFSEADKAVYASTRQAALGQLG